MLLAIFLLQVSSRSSRSEATRVFRRFWAKAFKCSCTRLFGMLADRPPQPVIGAQLSDPLNEYFFGRRGALFIAAIFSFSTVIGAAYVQSWYDSYTAHNHTPC